MNKENQSNKISKNRKTQKTKEILKKIRKIEIKTSKMVNDIFAGQYSSAFKGRGMEFSEIREYNFGDDIRNIDWNVTARTAKAHIKKFVEERELSVILMVDLSQSLFFGSQSSLKSEVVAEISAILAFSAIKNNDKVGMIIFTDKIEKFIPPKKGREHILRLIREILYFEPEGQKTDLNIAFEYLNEVIKRSAVVFLLSDFHSYDYSNLIKVINKKHDLINIRIKDEREEEIPKIGYISLQDNESGEIITVNSSSKKFQQDFEKIKLKKEEIFLSFMKKNSLQLIEVQNDETYFNSMINFFRRRIKGC